MGPSVCSAMFFFGTGLALRVTRLGPARRHLLPLAARPKTARTPRGKTRTPCSWPLVLREADPGRPQRPLCRTPNTKLCARPPCHGGHSETGCRPHSGSRLADGLCGAGIDPHRQGNARRAGQLLPFCLGAVQRPDARPGLSVGSWARLFGRRGAMAKVTEACDLTRKLAHDDRAQGRPGFTVSRACRPFPPVRRRSGPHRLRADGRGRGRRITGAKSKPCEPPSPALPLSAARRRKPGSPPSGETVRVGVARPALPAHRSACRWPGVWPHATDRQDPGAVLRNWEGQRRLRRERVGTTKKAPAGGARTA
jgi:hypothetical protein